jgi:biopolymer transport protein ExbD
MHSRRVTGRREYGAAKIEMAAMIDVVFLLLIFFVVTMKPPEVLARLDASRPQPGGDSDPAIVRIDVSADGYVVNGKAVSEAELDHGLTRIGRISTTPHVLIVCETHSLHSGLVRVLDLCTKARLRNVSVASQ